MRIYICTERARSAGPNGGGGGGNKCDCYLVSHDENHAHVSILLTHGSAFERHR